MRVGIVTTIAPERCGVRTYAEEIVKNSKRDNPDIEFKLIGRPFDGNSIIERSEDCDVIHVLHVHSLFGQLHPEHIVRLKSMGKKTVCTYNDCTGDNRSEFTMAFDRVTVHQPTSDGFQYLKHGIPWIEHPDPYTGIYKDYVGTAGFPIGFKNYPLAAELARAVGLKLCAFMPASEHADAAAVERQVLRNCPGSIVITDFVEHEAVVKDLAQCAFTLFPYLHTGTGVGGSVRMGIGAQRPVVISKIIRFADILHEAKYRDEFYIINDAYPNFHNSIGVVEEVMRDLSDGRARIPVQTLKDMSWQQSAMEYVKIYRDLTQ